MISGYKRLAVRRRAILNLTTGKAIRGIIYAQRGQLIEVRDAELLEPGMNPVPMSGTALVERGRVDFIQLLEE